MSGQWTLAKIGSAVLLVDRTGKSAGQCARNASRMLGLGYPILISLLMTRNSMFSLLAYCRNIRQSNQPSRIRQTPRILPTLLTSV